MATSAERPAHRLDQTQMAATRTLLSVVRTGATIAGGGAVVTNLLVHEWPRWVAATMSAAFVMLGYAVMWAAVKRGRKLRRLLQGTVDEEVFLFPMGYVTFISVALQVLIATVLLLYLLH